MGLQTKRPKQPEKRRDDCVGTHSLLTQLLDEALNFLAVGHIYKNLLVFYFKGYFLSTSFTLSTG
jgi:hypothetical protein